MDAVGRPTSATPVSRTISGKGRAILCVQPLFVQVVEGRWMTSQVSSVYRPLFCSSIAPRHLIPSRVLICQRKFLRATFQWAVAHFYIVLNWIGRFIWTYSRFVDANCRGVDAVLGARKISGDFRVVFWLVPYSSINMMHNTKI